MTLVLTSSVTVGKSFITFDSFPAFSLEKWGKEYCYHPAELFDGTRAYISKHYIIILIYVYVTTMNVKSILMARNR